MLMVVSSGLREGSKSRLLAEQAAAIASGLGAEVDYVDLSKIVLPICDGEGSYDSQVVKELAKRAERSTAVLFAAPVYNYGLSASLKNFIELVGGNFEGKVVGLMCAAGGERSYMAPQGFLSGMMLDFRSLVIPRYVYASPAGFEGEDGVAPSTLERLNELVTTCIKLATATNPAFQLRAVHHVAQ